MEKIVYISIFFAVLGLFFIYFFSPSQKYIENDIFEINQDCDGSFKTKGTLIRAFYSKKGNFIGVLSEGNFSLLVFLKNNSFYIGDEIYLEGQANRFSNACWFFPDKVELI